MSEGAVTVYVVRGDHPADDRVRGVFSTEQRAADFARALGGETETEVWVVDALVGASARPVWAVTVNLRGESFHTRQEQDVVPPGWSSSWRYPEKADAPASFTGASSVSMKHAREVALQALADWQKAREQGGRGGQG